LIELGAPEKLLAVACMLSHKAEGSVEGSEQVGW
jgi:hypothetical protein